jgi:hypothetical protein
VILKRGLIAGLVMVGLAACSLSQGHRFAVYAPDAQSAVLTLRNSSEEESKALILADGSWTGKMRFGDASGRIRLTYADGDYVDCLVGYVPAGAHRVNQFIVIDRVCEPVATEA